MNKRKFFLLFFTVCTFILWNAYVYYSSDSDVEEMEPLRADLIERIENISSDLITDNERVRIINLLTEVNGVRFSRNSGSIFGGALGGPFTRFLYLDKPIVERKEFHYERALILTLSHESKHWEDLQTAEFKPLTEFEVDRLSPDNLVLMTVLEARAYTVDFIKIRKFNLLDKRYLLPECFEFKGGKKTRVPMITAKIFGVGRARSQLERSIERLKELSFNEKISLRNEVVQLLKKRYPDMFLVGNVGVIDCLNKHGGG